MKVALTRSIATLAVVCLFVATAQAGVGTWSGGNDAWNALTTPWSGQSADGAFGSDSQLDSDDVANITDGSTVTGNPPETAPLADDGGDSHFKTGSVLNISGGSTLNLNSHDVLDGIWNKADSEINLDNGHINRTKSGSSVSGGFFMLGSWGTSTGQVVSMNLSNGGSFSNDGVVAFGMSNDSSEISAALNISGASTVDLTGGSATDPGGFPGGIDNGGLPVTNDIVFVNNFGHNNSYAINFSGPGGQLITDNGISIATQDILGAFSETFPTYEGLWDAGLLKAGGGNQGAFSDHFVVSGVAGQADYTLTSIIPEPTSIILALMGLVSFVGLRRRSR